MKIKTFILTFLMIMSGSILFGQSNVTPTTYASLKMALSGEMGTNVTITLADDINVTERIEIPATVTATLDLAGHTLSADEGIYAFNNMGKLTIKDSSSEGTGTIEARGIYNGSTGNVNVTTLTAELTIESGIFKAIGTDGGAAVYNLGTANINGGKFYGYYAALHNRLAEMTIKNAYIEAYDHNSYAAFRNSGNLTIGENVLLAGKYSHEEAATKTGDFKVVVAKIGDTPYVQFADVINDIKNVNGEVTVKLYHDVTMDITAWQTLAIGGENTTSITIDGENGDNDFTLTFNKLNSDWNHVATNGAELILKNLNLKDSGKNNGPWNRYDHNFACDVQLINVVSTKPLAFKAGATLNNVSITDSNDVYAIWVQANGQEINIDGLNINAGRGIKIDEQYVTAQNVSLSVANATFTTAKKAAIVIKSAAETEINVGENVDITNVAADNTNIAWVDTDAAVNYGNVTVTGGTLAQEDSDDFYAAHVDGEGNIVSYFETLQGAVDAANGKTIVLVQDYTEDVTISQEEGKNIIIDGKDFNFSGTIYIDGNSRFEGEETLTIQNFNFTTEEDSHDFISANTTDGETRYAHNVTVKDCEFAAPEDNTGVVGMRFRQAYNINVEDCKFENMFLGMWATGVSGVNVTKVMALSCKEGGFSFGQSTNIVVDDATIVASTGYGIRVDASVSTTLTVNKSRLTAKIPVVGRYVTPTADYTMIFSGDNEMTELNSHDKWLVVGKEDYTTNGYELPNIADSKVKVELNKEDNLNINGVYGAYQAIAKIGEVRYAFLQDAINAVASTEGEHTITMIGTSIEDENVTVPQTPNVKITIDGNSQNYRGTITVDGKSKAYPTAALTIKNFKFNAYSISKDAVINLGGNNNIRYTNNVTVENCSFTGNAANNDKVGVKSYTGGCKNFAINGCTADGMHSLIQLYATTGVTVADCNVTNSKNGVSVRNSSDVAISDCEMNVEGYGVRTDANSKGADVTITDCTIDAFIPVVVRKATQDYALNFEGENNFTENNEDNKWCVIGTEEYGEVKEDGTVITLENVGTPTGFVMVTLNDANLSYEGVYGGHTHEAKIGDTRYVFLQNALDAVEAGEQPTTIEIIRDVTSDATVSQVEGENIIIDGNGFNFSGTIYVDGNSRSTGTETLTIQNFNFTTEEDSHDFISANTTDGETRYAHNVTVKDCEFAAPEDNTGVVGMRFRQAYNINVEDCKFENMFLGMWATGVSGVNVTKVMALSCKEGGFSFGTSTNIVANTATIVASTGYGIRVDASVETTLTVENSNIVAKVPVVARYASENYNINFEGTNAITETNTNNDYYCVIGTDEYKGGETMPTPATGNVIVNLNDKDLSYDGVYGNFAVAKIGNVQYSTFAAALEAAQNGATIELIYKEGDAPIAMNGALYGKNVTVTGTATVDWSKGWLFIGRGGEGDAQLTFNNANLTSASDTKKYGINVSGKAADGHAYDGTLRIEGHSNIEVDYIITRNRLVVVGASTLTAKNGFVLGGRPAEETVNGNDATASVFLTNNAHIIVKGNKTTIGYEGKATIDLSTGGTSFKCYDHDVTITEKGIVNLDGATFNVTGENAVELANNGTVNVKGNSSLNIQKLTGNAINFNNVTIADAYIGGAVNAFGTNNFSGETNVTGILSVGYYGSPAEQVVVNIAGDFNGTNVLIGSSNDHVLNLGNADGERTRTYFGQLGAFGDVNIVNSDVTYGYAFVRNDFNVTNSTMDIIGGVNTYFAGNAKVVVDNSTWSLPGYANIGSYGGYQYGSADVTLKNGSSMTATGLGIEVSGDNVVKLTLEDNSTLTAKNLTNQGSIVLAGVDAKVTSNELTGTNNVPTTSVDYKKVAYVDGSYVVIDKDYVAQILDAEGNSSLDRRYESFAEALNEVQNKETIELINANTLTLDESTQKLTFERDIEFNIEGVAPEYKLPIVTFRNARVNINNAEFRIPELDARTNAVINVNNSKLNGVNSNDIVKAKNNGVININGESVIHTMQLTTMGGIININNKAQLNATWQINAHGNGLITVNDEAQLNAAALNLISRVWDNGIHANPDREDYAQIIVDGATLIVGKVTNANGSSYDYNSEKYGINIGTYENLAAVLDIINGAKVEFYMNPAETNTSKPFRNPVIGTNGVINIDASTFNVISRTEGETLICDNAGTINVTGAAVLSATVTGEGSVNMNDVALTETTNFVANNINFAGENGNSITGAKIEANGNAIVKDVKLEVNAGSDLKFNKLTVNKQLSISKGKLRVTTDFVNGGITSINYVDSDVYVFGTTTNNSVLNISNKAVYKTGKFVNNSENLNVSSNSTLQINGAATFVENSISKIAGEVSVGGSVTQEENAVIRLTDAAAKFTTTNTELEVVTTVEHSKVVYTNGAYVVVAKHYVAYIGETGYESLQEAFDAAEVEGTTIELSYNEGDAPISMNASLYGKNVTISGTATVDWAGWLYVGRGGIGNAELIFENANLTSSSSGEGINVSCAKNTDESVCNGKVTIINSTINLPEFVNRNIVVVENSTINTTHVTSGGRPASETTDGKVATAEFTLTNSKLNAVGNITNGYEGIGIMNVDANSNVNVDELTVTATGTLNSAGNITGAIVKAEEGTIQLTGGIYTTEPQEGWCAENYGAFPYDETSWIVREVYGTQTIALQAGWNWVSTYIEQFGEEDGLAMLQNGLGDNGNQIKNKFVYSTNFGGEIGWFGELEETSELQMYMVNVFESQDLRLEGDYVNYEAEDNAIGLNHGWNWIAYSVSEEINISDALSNLEATTGDIIKTMGASAVYLNGNWVSSNLKSLKPGSGYMYKNNGEFTSFNYSSRVTTTPSGSADNRANNHWTADIAQYPNNMTMIAMTDVEGDNYEVAAFVNGEVRGSARPVYVEELNAYILVLTISGDNVAEVSFMYYDLTTGEEVEFSNRINYSNDAIVGSITEPYMLTRGTTGIGEAAMSQVNIYPNPTTTGTEINLQTVCDTVEVFNALGVKVAEYQNVDSIDALETAGIYVIRITNDGNVQNCRLVVK